MPAWVQIIGALTAIVALLTALWSKILRPGAGLITSTEEMLPLLRELTLVFRDSPGVFEVLHQIASQFRTDSGSSLRDVVNRLEAAAVENRMAGEHLKVGVEASRLLSERDRQQLDRLIVLLDRLTIRVDAITASGLRIEIDRAQVATDLGIREEQLDAATSVVAADLAASRQRAADIDTDDTGAAADAAALPAELPAVNGPFIPVDASGDEAREIVAAWQRAQIENRDPPS